MSAQTVAADPGAIGVTRPLLLAVGLPEMLPGLALYHPQAVWFDSGYFGVSTLALHLVIASLVITAIVASQTWPRLSVTAAVLIVPFCLAPNS